ncbi:Vacuolar fusion protein ccz1 [Coniochaeta hoffmannii]|uniref:Vacuolar fusion protein ccz1 n=1 Tax=Coniochaeta hoffmannii TaxID=91930 RepID=A0AA38SD63_9PEZI|nr:Vacuolar fusion protein ccz1 [Coniochaeta hoffmannii]
MAAPNSGPGGAAPPAAAVVPAQLGFLAIYNPSLGTTDETMEDQIVYYSTVSSFTSQSRKQRGSSSSSSAADHLGSSSSSSSREDRNERLRQIGLAQGMVEFGRSFSGDRPVDTVETEKSRVVLHELEPGWWILASVDLTRLPVAKGKETRGTEGEGLPAVEYSSREVKPATLLLQDLLRAHSVFLLHHGSSLSALFVRTNRQRFTSVVSRFWDIFLASWNVTLHGNPLRNIFGGIKIAACGELGFGVGEEERGSGEREVLEGLVGRIDGLIDLVVGKFGKADEGDNGKTKGEGGGTSDQWLGTGNEPGAEDGVIFLGVGALSRHSLRDVTFWMEDLYTWGENAYGVKESPTARRRPNLRRKKHTAKPAAPSPPAPAPAPVVREQPAESGGKGNFGPPPPIAKPAAQAAAKPTSEEGKETAGVDKMMGYLKLGYGTYWSLGSSPTPGQAAPELPEVSVDPPSRPSISRTASRDDAAGHYLIGLMGDVEENTAVDDDPEEEGHNSRTLLRTLTVELESEGTDKPESQMSHDLGSNDTELAPHRAKSPASSSHTVKNKGPKSNTAISITTPSKDSSSSQTSRGSSAAAGDLRDGAQNQQTAFDSQDRNKTKKVRVVAYVNKPFIFVFLFDLQTDSLNWDAAYRSLHRQLAPLRKPLLASTAYRPHRPAAAGGQKIYDLVWDPRSLTVHSTIPNIPGGGRAEEEGEEVWSRVEALNTHVQLLNTHASTRGGGREMELERTAKTSRGWWIVWSRVLERGPASAAATSGSIGEEDEEEEAAAGRSQGGDGASGRSGRSGSTEDEITPTQDGAVVGKEIYLIRKSGDHAGGGGVRSYVSAGVGGGGGWADGASRLAQGIGVDTRKYIEGLLSLNR